MLTSREYEEKRGCYCPVCGSEDMEGERVESHDGGGLSGSYLQFLRVKLDRSV